MPLSFDVSMGLPAQRNSKKKGKTSDENREASLSDCSCWNSPFRQALFTFCRGPYSHLLSGRSSCITISRSSTMDRKIFRSFKSKGLSVSSEATRALASVLSREDNADGSLALILDEIKERIDKRQIKSSVIDEEVISSVVAYLSSSEEDLAQESTQVPKTFIYTLLLSHRYYLILTHLFVFSQ